MSTTVVVNPISGSGRHPDTGRRRRELAQAALAAAGTAGVVRVTEGVGHAAALAREAVERGATLVVAWGGDGTANEVASALVFRDVALGLVPAGSGNGLARELGVPGRPAAALQAALRGRDRLIDVGELGGRLFLNLAGIGLDAAVAARFNARHGGRRGLWPYLLLGVREACRYRARDYRIRVDGVPRETRALAVVWANGREYGGGARVAPGAVPDDGAADLVVVGDRSRAARLWEARRLFTGTLPAAAGVWTHPCRTLEVEGDEPIGFHVDGEPVQGPARLAGRLHPRALRVRVPG
jgi:YegS/Rv2252/BmrU family lipid kinase